MPTVTAEIGINHAGSARTATLMIDAAASCGATHVKFQKRSAPYGLTPTEFEAPHPNPEHAFGPTYGAHRQALEFSIDDHQALALHALSKGLKYACSVWDPTALIELLSIGDYLDYIKIPSAHNTNFKLIDDLYDRWPGPVRISLGMTTEEDRREIVDHYSEHWDRTTLMICTSAYPCDFRDICLGDIAELYGEWDGDIGFSGHHRGIAIDIAAYAIGADHIERHFTLDRTSKGSDHAASLEPSGLTKLCRDLEAVKQALHVSPVDLKTCEIPCFNKLKWDRSQREA